MLNSFFVLLSNCGKVVVIVLIVAVVGIVIVIVLVVVVLLLLSYYVIIRLVNCQQYIAIATYCNVAILR